MFCVEPLVELVELTTLAPPTQNCTVSVLVVPRFVERTPVTRYFTSVQPLAIVSSTKLRLSAFR